ncbi:E3 ubiquitin ligase SCF complex, Skp subunit [Schizopora paradoxa]|uniref:E3 ubiquitin ligase complex SCF subunit n=1 Tax=Schizopora paradoxa TaxID=27342 RepID=A0A0H2RL76_9AGAM|nr:E3 ubiquitin ligase SCF complex, Skp subunit [Schizopora paradoxa]
MPWDSTVPLMVEIPLAFQMRIVKNMVEDVGLLDEAIPLPNVSGEILKIVLEYCDKHQDDGYTEPNEETLEMEEWDREFLERHITIIFRLSIAADYLDIRPLLDVICKFIVYKTRGKNPYQNRKFFRIESDWSPEEAKQIMKENGWIEGQF